MFTYAQMENKFLNQKKKIAEILLSILGCRGAVKRLPLIALPQAPPRAAYTGFFSSLKPLS